jgi:hypothetical protein
VLRRILAVELTGGAACIRKTAGIAFGGDVSSVQPQQQPNTPARSRTIPAGEAKNILSVL